MPTKENRVFPKSEAKVMRIRGNLGLMPMYVFCLMILLTSAAGGQAEKDAVQASKEWLALVDGGGYSESWDKAAELFKAAVTKEQWKQAMTANRKPLGSLISRELKSKDYRTSLPGAPDGEYVVIQFQTSFQNKQSAIETVTPMLDKDGKWRVSGYFIK